MAAAKEIRTKIKSVQNTQKITRAMEMVAASKMRKAQDRMAQARPYAEKIRTVISHLAAGQLEYVHPFMEEREVKRVAYIVVSTDRGLCGALNTNSFRKLVQHVDGWREQGIEADFVAIGQKASMFLKRFSGDLSAQATHLGDAPALDQLIGTIKVVLDAYLEGRVDRVYLVFNRFVNSMTQEPIIEQLIPRAASDAQEIKHHWDYIYEPSSEEVIDMLLTRYVESLVYQGVVENVACEMAARMVAMKAASDNAGSLISELQLAYNKARQAAITQEISEIVGGAEAL